MAEQAGSLEWASLDLGLSHPVAAELAERLTPLVPVDDPLFLFGSTGSEANETAFKVARAYHRRLGRPGRVKIIGRDGSYHGSTYGAMSATGIPESREPFAPARAGVRPRDPAVARALRPLHARGRLFARVRPRRRAGDPARGARHRRRRHRRADRVPAGDQGAARRLLPGAARHLHAPRRAAHRRRGDHRLRAHRPHVRARPLGRHRRHPHRREGHHERLRPAGRGRRLGRDRGSVRRRAAGPHQHVRGPPRVVPRGPGDARHRRAGGAGRERRRAARRSCASACSGLATSSAASARSRGRAF